MQLMPSLEKPRIMTDCAIIGNYSTDNIILAVEILIEINACPIYQKDITHVVYNIVLAMFCEYSRMDILEEQKFYQFIHVYKTLSN